MLRGSYATGFKSPKLTEAYASSFGAYFFTVDRKRCNETGAADACRSRAYQGAVASNPNLKEEESQTWNIGAVMQPTKYASIGVDF